jgi:hypothetical protein
MGKHFNQSGHYRTYKQTGNRITVNGGPKEQYTYTGTGELDEGCMVTLVIMLFVAIGGMIVMWNFF